MKRLWFAALLLVLIFSATLWNQNYLNRFTTQIVSRLQEAETKAENGGWEEAAALTEQAKSLWESREAYLYITLFHKDTDEVYSSFREVLELLYGRQSGEYSAANSRLISKLELIHEMDEFSIQNIL